MRTLRRHRRDRELSWRKKGGGQRPSSSSPGCSANGNRGWSTDCSATSFLAYTRRRNMTQTVGSPSQPGTMVITPPGRAIRTVSVMMDPGYRRMHSIESTSRTGRLRGGDPDPAGFGIASSGFPIGFSVFGPPGCMHRQQGRTATAITRLPGGGAFFAVRSAIHSGSVPAGLALVGCSLQRIGLASVSAASVRSQENS